MFFAADHAALAEAPEIRRSMLADRAEQFVARHKWPLRLDASGLEIDEYDDALTTYCIVADRHRHVASLRLRPASAGSMTEQHFPGLWRGLGTKLSGGVEITRFCSAPGQSPDERLTAVSDLLLGLCRHCQRSGIGGVFGVVFPAVARVIKQAGWPGVVLNTARDASGTLLLAEWIPTDLVAWNIQEQRELREEIWARRRRAAAEPERLVA
jgi:N-acyl-L-homoserine lactone synthetase